MLPRSQQFAVLPITKIKVGMEMARLTGRLLDKPFLKDGLGLFN